MIVGFGCDCLNFIVLRQSSYTGNDFFFSTVMQCHLVRTDKYLVNGCFHLLHKYLAPEQERSTYMTRVRVRVTQLYPPARAVEL